MMGGEKYTTSSVKRGVIAWACMAAKKNWSLVLDATKSKRFN